MGEEVADLTGVVREFYEGSVNAHTAIEVGGLHIQVDDDKGGWKNISISRGLAHTHHWVNRRDKGGDNGLTSTCGSELN